MASTVIKASGPLKLTEALPFRFDDMHAYAQRHLEEVRASAAKIIADARTEAESIRKQAEADGRQAAVNAAQKLLEEKIGKQMETLVPALRQTIASLAQSKTQWLRQWEASAVQLAVKIAERIVRRQLPQMPEVPLTLITEALELAQGSPRLTIRLNPADHATLGSKAQKLTAELSRVSTAQVVADESVSLGGCRVETEFGVIDQQIEAQLARIAQELA